jgi:hypothetical protein
MGQTTSFNANLIKSNVLVMGLASLMARHDISRRKRKRNVYFYGGHDPEDYQHQVGDPTTVLDLHPNSPGYRLI